ncbi:hypothetical protein BZG36_00680 [Bifiguratus adelaidae]|uniref:Uncharacterized protein n=1 Tax=Bifiguratus adelaidae TaxID=1938954 RepID=A0A261Y6P5_9FUNG|nr:hypothetical protein BZG36_00680 [Bifiguratus adelaidae]
MANVAPRIRTSSSFLNITPEMLVRLSPSLAGWGAAAGLGALYFLSGVPIVKRDILSKVPVIGEQFKVEMPKKEE